MFFSLTPQSALLSDKNEELINAYQCVKAEPAIIEAALHRLHRLHSKALYYRIRKTMPVDCVERAIRFIYLNRTCFNGMYRVNRLGQFNVPIGTKTLVSYNGGYLESVAQYLERATIQHGDFEAAINTARRGDVVFADPPYTVKHNTNNFVKYNAALFSWDDQVRLAAALQRAESRGATIVLSNANHGSIRYLYKGFGRHYTLARATVLAADSASRGPITELLIIA